MWTGAESRLLSFEYWRNWVCSFAHSNISGAVGNRWGFSFMKHYLLGYLDCLSHEIWLELIPVAKITLKRIFET